MKLIGSKEKGYKLVSSFEDEKTKKPKKPEKPDEGGKGGTTGPDQGRKEE